MKLTKIAEITRGVLHGDEIEVSEFVTDSRGRLTPDSIFVALSGEHFDGHDFATNAIDGGSVALLCSRKLPIDVPQVIVSDTLEALQIVATFWRKEIDPTVIAVIGSNGKTIIKDMLAAMLSRKATTFRSPGSYNSQVGVALSLLSLRSEHRFAVIEAGISERGEMDRLRAMIKPDAVVWSNVGDAHAAGLGDRTGIASEKSRMVTAQTPVVFPSSDDAIKHVVTSNERIPIEPRNVLLDSSGATFSVGDKETVFRIFAPGEHNVMNAALAIAMARSFDVDDEQIKLALVGYEPADLRLQIHTTSTGISLINDSYNSDLTSARSALNALVHYGAGHRRVAVLGDMLDLGDRSGGAHLELGAMAAESADVLIAIGQWGQVVRDGARNGGMSTDATFAFESVEDATGQIRKSVEPGDYLLVKGSRATELDRVAEQFLDSVGPARLTIDLDAIARNLNSVRAAVAPAAVMAVVKSFAYGNDATRVSQRLIQNGVTHFAVAYPDEAIPLRRRGIPFPILVTNVLEEEVDKIARYDLTALVSRLGMIDVLERIDQPLNVHLEIETGMNRLGLTPDETILAAHRIAKSKTLNLTGVMTHFAAADDPTQDDFTQHQISSFERTLERIQSNGIDPGVVHAANTAAAWRFPSARFDMVRIGIGIYGCAPSANVDAVATIEPALRFTTRVIDVRRIKKGDSVGYGRTWFAERETDIATIAVGYNDGFGRYMSNGGNVLVGGERCSVIGTVCMDATMIDVTGVSVSPGDEVVIFGEQRNQRIEIEELSSRGETIPYEVLTQISPRVRRIFTRS